MGEKMKVNYRVVKTNGYSTHDIIVGEFETIVNAEQFRNSFSWYEDYEVKAIRKMINCPICDSFTSTSLILTIKHLYSEANHARSLLNDKKISRWWSEVMKPIYRRIKIIAILQLFIFSIVYLYAVNF